MALKAEPATLSDLPRLVDIFYTGFNDDFFEAIFPPTPEARQYISDSYEGFIKSRWDHGLKSNVFVTRDENGKAVSSIVYWIIPPGNGGLSPWWQRWPAAKPTMSDDALNEFFMGMQTQHHAVMKDKEHIYLEIVCTHERFRRRGHGTTLLEVGNKMADEMDYILYLDSEKNATKLYQKVGYALRTDVEQTSPLAAMMRPKKSQRV